MFGLNVSMWLAPPERYRRTTDLSRTKSWRCCAPARARVRSSPGSVRPATPSAPTRRKSRRDRPEQSRHPGPVRSLSMSRSPCERKGSFVLPAPRAAVAVQVPRRGPRQKTPCMAGFRFAAAADGAYPRGQSLNLDHRLVLEVRRRPESYAATLAKGRCFPVARLPRRTRKGRMPAVRNPRRATIEPLERRTLFATPQVPGLTESIVVQAQLSNPTAMEFAPDGRLFVLQQGGQIRVIKNGALLATPFHTITPIDSGGERGLLGIAFDPNFAANRFLYVYHT